MDKETLVRNLQEKIGDGDFGVLSQRTVDSIIDPLLPMFADDSTINEESFTLPVNLLKSYIGQYRHDVSEGIKKGIAQNAPKQEPVEQAVVEKPVEQKVVETNHQPTQTTDLDTLITDKLNGFLATLSGDDGVLGKLSKEFNAFKVDYETRRTNERIADIKDRLSDFMLSLDSTLADDDFVLEYTLERFDVNLDEDFEAQSTKFKDLYEKNYKRINKGKTFTPMEGGAGGGSDSTQAFNTFIKERADQEAAAQRDAEELKKMLM